MQKINLCGLLPDEILKELNLKQAFRAKQIFKWVSSGIKDFSLMTNLSLDLRNELKEKACLRTSSISNVLKDTDGTVKLQITLQ